MQTFIPNHLMPRLNEIQNEINFIYEKYPESRTDYIFVDTKNSLDPDDEITIQFLPKENAEKMAREHNMSIDEVLRSFRIANNKELINDLNDIDSFFDSFNKKMFDNLPK